MEPQAFLKAVRNFDPDLDIRWGPVINQWVVERKAFIPTDEIFFLRKRENRLSRFIRGGDNRPTTLRTYRGVTEEHTSARDGKRVICFAPLLNDDLFNSLCLSDIKRYGGYSRMAEEMDKADSKRQAEKERADEQNRLALHKEAHSIHSFLCRKRSDAMANGERSLKRLLGVKKVLN